MGTKAGRPGSFERLATLFSVPAPLPLTIAWIVTLAVLAAGSVVLAFPVLLTVFALLVFVLLMTSGHKPFRIDHFDPTTIGFLAFTGYMAMSATWSPIPHLAFLKSSLIALCIASIWLARRHMETCDGLQLHRLARGLFLGLLIVLVYLDAEFASDLAIIKFIAQHWPGGPGAIDSSLRDEFVPQFYYNRSVTASVLFFWPVALTTWYWLAPKLRQPAVALLAAALVPILLLTQSQTAAVGGLLGLVAFLIARFGAGRIRILAGAAWTIAVVAIMPIVETLHALGLHQAGYLPLSFRERIAIWHTTTQHVFEAPLIGNGIRAGRSEAEMLPHPRQITDDHLGRHAHDLFLQVWYELGAVGALLLLAIGLLLLRSIDRLAEPVRPYAYASLGTMCGIAAFGYGAWQSWLLACYAWTFILFIIGNETFRRRSGGG